MIVHLDFIVMSQTSVKPKKTPQRYQRKAEMKKLKVKKRLKRSIKKLRKPIPTVKLEIFCVAFVSFNSFLPFLDLSFEQFMMMDTTKIKKKKKVKPASNKSDVSHYSLPTRSVFCIIVVLFYTKEIEVKT